MKMKQFLFLLLVLTILSCDSNKTVDYSKLDKLSELNEKVLVDFYKNVLDTLIGDNYLESNPIFKTELIEKNIVFKGVSHSDKIFFKQQNERFSSFTWEEYLDKEKLLSTSEFDSTFKKHGARIGWEIFREKHGKCCICFMSLPLFTSDFKRIYIDFGIQCAPLWGHGEILVFEFLNGKWKLIDRYETWIS